MFFIFRTTTKPGGPQRHNVRRRQTPILRYIRANRVRWFRRGPRSRPNLRMEPFWLRGTVTKKTTCRQPVRLARVLETAFSRRGSWGQNVERVVVLSNGERLSFLGQQ